MLIRTPNWIGDAVMCEPAIGALRDLFPAAELAALARPSIAELLQGHPAINRAIIYDHTGRHRGLVGTWRLGRALRDQRFDLAVLFQNAFDAAWLAVLAGIPLRHGYKTDGRGWLLTHGIAPPQTHRSVHQADYFYQLLAPLGPTKARRPPRLHVSEIEEEAMMRRLAAAGVGRADAIVGLNPGSTYGGAKRWFPERFAATADQLVERLVKEGAPTARVVIVGAAGEEPLGETIAKEMRTAPIRMAGQTTVRELMALIKRCRVFVTNDTGPMHIAAAFGVPTVAVFGPTNDAVTSPAGGPSTVVRHPVDCAPCLLRECPIDHRCMTGVSVDVVVEAATTLLKIETGEGSKVGVPKETTGLRGDPSSILDGVTVFLDRDGTLNREVGYIGQPADIELFPGAAEAVAGLNRAGARVVLITNQSGIGRGLFSSADLTRVHERVQALLATAGARLDAIYYCPHLPEDDCPCRKPGTALVERAVKELGLDLSKAYVVGDRQRDMQLAQRIGAKGALVITASPHGEAADEAPLARALAHHVASSLRDAVGWIMQDARARSSLNVS